MTSTPLPMFPLGTVLFPTAVLPLRLFEPRYLRFIDDVLAADRTFGVTLIERGSEVGGADQRSAVGCLAEIRQATPRPDGTWGIVAVGVSRLVVDEWLDDDPYPRALVSHAPDDGDVISADADTRWLELDTEFRALLRLLGRTGGSTVSPTVELSTDPAIATFQMASVIPINPFDRQQILADRSVDGRRQRLHDAFETVSLLVGGPETN